MPRPFKMSIATLMALIALVAAELALFQEVLFILVIPPVTMAVVLLNLGMFFVLGRKSFLGDRITGMLLGGLFALFLMVAYYMTSGPPTQFLGPIGARMHGWLFNRAGAQPDPAGATAASLRHLAGYMRVLEVIMVDLAGVALIWAGGHFERRLRGTGPRAPAAHEANGPRS